MKTTTTVILVTAAFAATSAFAQQPTPEPKKEAPAAGESRFAKMDTDKDGKISLAEFTGAAKKPENASKAFTKKDTDKDGSLSKKELAAKPAGGAKKEKTTDE